MRWVFPGVRHLPPAQLSEWLAQSARARPLLLDVRSPEEFAVSHLPGAHRVEAGVGADEVLAGVAPGQAIICYCAAGWRSSLLALRLARAGHREVYNLEGAIFDWACEGRPLERNGEPARTVHPFNWMGRLMLPEGVCAGTTSLRD